MIRKLALAAATAVAALALSTSADAADPVRIGVALSQTGNLADSAAGASRRMRAADWLDARSSSSCMTTAPIPPPPPGSTNG